MNGTLIMINGHVVSIGSVCTIFPTSIYTMLKFATKNSIHNDIFFFCIGSGIFVINLALGKRFITCNKYHFKVVGIITPIEFI